MSLLAGHGIVGGIDRTAGTIYGRMLGSLTPFEDVEILGAFPPVMSRVAIEDYSGRRVCAGIAPTINYREVLYDDFTLVDAAFGYGETPWRQLGTLDVINTATGIDAVGAVRLRSAVSGAEQWLAKNDGNLTLRDDQVVSVTCRFTFQQSTSLRYRLGLATDNAANDVTPGIAGGAGVYLSADTSRSANFELVATTDTTVSTTVLPAAIDTAWHVLDLVACGDQWAALSLDGDGPYYVEGAAVPGAADPGPQPLIYMEPLVSSARVLLVDYYRVEVFDPVVAPSWLLADDAVLV